MKMDFNEFADKVQKTNEFMDKISGEIMASEEALRKAACPDVHAVFNQGTDKELILIFRKMSRHGYKPRLLIGYGIGIIRPLISTPISLRIRAHKYLKEFLDKCYEEIERKIHEDEPDTCET